jgi:hypothetical protein
MSLRAFREVFDILFSIESRFEQRLAWADAAEARLARARAEKQAAAQLKAMLEANPSGQLGHGKVNDEQRLKDAGLL